MDEEGGGGASVIVDTTLTQTGQAADAKAVGDALAGKQPVGDYATEDYVDSAISAIPTPDVSGQINTHNTDTNSHSDIRGQISSLSSEIANKSAVGHEHNKSEITDFPTSMPASDVPSWAKASSKPSYTPSEIGLKTETWTFTLEDGSTVTKAVYVGGVPTITFTFGGNTYKTEEGMTWEEWVNSSYNPNGRFYADDYFVYDGESYAQVGYNGGTPVTKSDLIESGYAYVTIF